MVDEGVTHVMVHLHLFEHEAPMVLSGLAEQRMLRLIAADAYGHQLYEVLADADAHGH